MPTTPYMSLLLPTVSTTMGPEWATELNDALGVVDSHNHTSGQGVPVPSDGMNINASLSFNAFDATALRSTRFSAQPSPLGEVTDIGCIYVSGVDMWFNDGNGNQIQLTASGALNAASIGGIGGDYSTSTASVSYLAASTKFVFLQDTNEAAIMDVGPVILRNVTASSAGITMKPAAGLSAGWTLTLPLAPPASAGPVMVDGSGNLSFLAAPSPTEIGYVTGLTQAAQTQIDRLRLESGSTYDLGMTYDSGTLTIHRAGGGALGSTNYGSVCVPSTTAGQLVTLKVLANAEFDITTTVNLGWGITESANWNLATPFTLYVANRNNTNLDGADGSSQFFISRNPCLIRTPTSADDIGDAGAIPVNDGKNVILFLEDVTVANYVSLPCQAVACFRMTWTASSSQWSVETLGNADGFGLGQMAKMHATLFNMPTGQNGAASGKYFVNGGGTAPVFSSNTYQFYIRGDGYIDVLTNFSGDGGADGSGGQLELALPVSSADAVNLCAGAGFIEYSGGVSSQLAIVQVGATSNGALFTMQQTDTTVQTVTNGQFSSGGRVVRFGFRYRGFSNAP